MNRKYVVIKAADSAHAELAEGIIHSSMDEAKEARDRVVEALVATNVYSFDVTKEATRSVVKQLVKVFELVSVEL